MMLLLLLLAAQAEAPPAREKFAIFSEPDDAPIGGWEFDPARPEAGFVQRAEFAPGYLRPLFQFERPDIPEFLAHRIDGPKQNEEIWRVHRIDYETWITQEVLSSARIHTEGAGDGIVYVQTAEGLRLIDRTSGVARASDPPGSVAVRFGHAMLVKLENGPHALLDVRSGKILEGRYSVPSVFRASRGFLRLSPDRRFLATVVEVAPTASAPFSGVVDVQLRLFDLKLGTEVFTKFRMHWSVGSGDSGGPSCHELRWSDDGRSLICTYSAETTERLTLDALTLAVRSRETADPPSYERSDLFPGFPEELKPFWESLKDRHSGWPERRMGLALLKHQKVPLRDLEGETRFLSDRKRFLLLEQGTRSAYLGDLSGLSVRRFEMPAALAGARGLSIHPVPAR
jgi:hypothetical protein